MYKLIFKSSLTRIRKVIRIELEFISNKNSVREQDREYINTHWCALSYTDSHILSLFTLILHKIQAVTMFGGHHHGKNNITIYLKLSINFNF
jgi:uncharacterized membrane protein YcgQ (UPF0703/DUF1980 family)